MRIPAPTIFLFLLFATSCDNSVDSNRNNDDPDTLTGTGSIHGYINAYSECKELVNKSGFTVGVLHSSKTAVTDSAGYFSIKGLQLGTDTVIVTKAGFQSGVGLVQVNAGVSQYLYIQNIYRLNNLEAKYTSEWALIPTRSEVTLDSFFVNSYGDLVKVSFFRIIDDTLLTIEAAVQGSPSIATHIRLAPRRDGERETQKGFWNSFHDIVVRTGNTHSVSLHDLRRYDDVRPGDTIYAYVQAFGACGNQDKGQYTDVRSIIIP